MVKKHLKRMAAPGYWPISVKERKWVARPRPGPHPKERSIPAIVIIREVLGYAANKREAKIILNQGNFIVDGKTVKDPRYPVGLMDTISFPLIKKYYRVVASKRVLSLIEIPEDEATKKLVKIIGKRTVKKGKIQLNLHDGRNILIPVDNPKEKPDIDYRVGDSLLISLPGQEILAHIPEKSGNRAVIVGGSHISQQATLLEIKKKIMKPDISVLVDKAKFETLRKYVFMIGEGDSSVITVGEAK